MTVFSIRLVNHTKATPRLQGAIETHLQDLFNQVFVGTSDSATVGWGTAVAADSIVIHLVDDIADSYLQQKMPGNTIRADGGGHTRLRGKVTGSEIYLHPVIGGRRTMVQDRAYAKIAFHEALHNQWPGWSNQEIHAKDGMATSPPGDQLSADNKTFMRRGMAIKNQQLL